MKSPSDPHWLSKQAGVACADAAFRRWLQDETGMGPGDILGAADASVLVRLICEVESRAEFDTDPAAGRRWKELYAKYEQAAG